jgi:peptidoglycan/xylan/chitin deacetylase (PgdA/CDA1 family)
VNRAILKALSKYHAPAIAFVNEKKVVGDGNTRGNREILREWIKHGNELGNHTYSHADLDKLSVEGFEKEILDGEPSVRALMNKKGKPLRYFRFPFNHTGETAGKHDAIAAFLKQHGYQVATCTIENEDWIFTHAYELMLKRKDTNSANRLQDEYLAFTRKRIEYFGQLGQKIFGRDIPQVTLLHANRLNADTISDILKIYLDLGYQFVTLEKAQSDPAYKTPDTYFNEYGWMWGYRWAKEKHIKVDGRLEPEVPEWVENYK